MAQRARGLATAGSRAAELQRGTSYELVHYDQRTGSDSHEWLLLCILMLLYIVKRLGVLFLAGYRVDPLGGTLFEFGQVSFASFDFADAA